MTDINFYLVPEPQPPQRPQVNLSPNDVRKIFLENQDFWQNLRDFGYDEEEASRMVLNHCKKK